MAIKLGNILLEKMYLGSTLLTSVYLGAVRVAFEAIFDNYIIRVEADGGTIENETCARAATDALVTSPSLFLSPSGFKAGVLYNEIPDDADFVVDRNSTATRVNEDGDIETVAVDVPRVDFTGGGCGVLLTEAQATNLINESNDLSTWDTANVTVTQDAVISPDGTLNGIECDVTNVANNTRFDGAVVVASTEYTFSFWAKRGTATGLNYAVYDASNSAFIVSPTSYYGQTSAAWSRVSLTFTTPVGCISALVYMNSNSPSLGTTYFWESQLELGDKATSNVPTAGSTVTRLEDEITILMSTVTPTVTEIIETIDGVEQTPITVIPTTYQIPVGNINEIIMNE